MFSSLFRSFGMAIQSIRSRVWHTLLSVLGIIIGVAALVATLSLIDGLEAYANEQIGKTTSLKAVMISSNQYERVNGVSVKIDSIPIIDYQSFEALSAAMTLPHTPYLRHRRNRSIKLVHQEDKLAAVTHYTTGRFHPDREILLAGQFYTPEAVQQQAHSAVVNEDFAQLILKKMSAADTTDYAQTLNQQIVLQDSLQLSIIGVVENDDFIPPSIYIPVTHLPAEEIGNRPPTIALEAQSVEDVDSLKNAAISWLKTQYGDQHQRFSVQTNGFRVQQAAQGFMVFRIIMGMIVGLSVLVGGIGVMNVLLISVSERTSEIGIRKALGASKRAITTQFLSESIAVSVLGSSIGVLIGMGFAALAVPILKFFMEGLPFGVSFTMNTMVVTAVLAILIGIIFGTYPAMKAARLDPVTAIQRE